MAHSTLPDIQIPQGVEQFCTSHGILPDLLLAIRLADETFPPIRDWQFTVEADPETGDEAVVIDIHVPTSLETASAADWTFSRKWAAARPKAGPGRIVLISSVV
jgi:hypothetical protein